MSSIREIILLNKEQAFTIDLTENWLPHSSAAMDQQVIKWKAENIYNSGRKEKECEWVGE